MDDKFTERTKDWTEVNNGKTKDTHLYDASSHDPAVSSEDEVSSTSSNDEVRSGAREIGEERVRKLALAKSAVVDFSVNGKITTMSYSQFQEFAHDTVKDFALWPVLDDETMSQRDWKEDEVGETFEVAMRIRSEEPSSLSISHIYYA
eukprot:635718-Ditylum_brightwellii.AAC.1